MTRHERARWEFLPRVPRWERRAQEALGSGSCSRHRRSPAPPAAACSAPPSPPAAVTCPCPAGPDLSTPAERGRRSPGHPPPPAPLLPAGWFPGQLSSSQRCSATPTTQGHSSTSQFRIGRRSRRPLPLRAGLSQRRRRDGPARPPAAPPRSAGPGSAAPRPPGAAVPPRPGRAAAARAAAAAAYSPHNAAGRRGSAAASRVSHGGG